MSPQNSQAVSESNSPPLPKSAWEQQENEVEESADSHGFRITHRWQGNPGGIAWKNPAVRGNGFDQVELQDGDYSASVETTAGRVDTWIMADKVEPRSAIAGSSWKLDPEPRVGDEELTFKYKYPKEGDGIPNDLSAQKILRTLGFRPPHTALFLLSYHELVRLRAFTHARVCRDFDVCGSYIYSAEKSQSPMQAIGGSSVTTAEPGDAVKELTENIMRSRRAKLDSSGFTSFPEILKPLLDDSDENISSST